ncbi:SpvB/TcaC N-terminal domain-containing protein [Pseudomonas sp. GL-B-19]|uniref:SpvB/TcaC N-terminal domain-containing protein n=1 Tax=Pseudomonas sp. GL-B-19 TaxID=2832393 RepID=UPI001CC0F7FA|nr:SpvB/TcaC N-terminal domain-containing protein [Pseudomonas sp. GL-B-19]
MSSRTLALPVSAGRGHAPALSLNYSSGSGNGAFAMGWGLSEMTIRRRTSRGAPLYQEDDTYLAPDGEVLVPETGSDHNVITTQRDSYGGLDLDHTYTVTRYFPCIEGSFSRIERWSPATTEGDFWLLHTADGQLHCLGKSAEARITDPAQPGHIGVWLLEESVTLTGEHIRYRYKQEDTANCILSGQEASRSHTANRYLQYVEYGNVTEYQPLYAWRKFTQTETPAWLFTLVFDYGERTLDPLIAPPLLSSDSWPCRADSFSDYSFGFEVRTHRLCQQVLMFHHFSQELEQSDKLVSRLLLEYQQSPQLTQLIGAQVLAYERDGTVQSRPPVDWSYSSFTPDFNSSGYSALPSFPSLNDGQQYQLVDLLGEGLSGVLYQEGNDWRYRAPIRGTQGPDAVSYAPWQSLPQLPSLLPEGSERKALVDLMGTGRLNWLIAQPGLAGYFTLNPDQRWSHFVPSPAFPTEFLHPSAQMADLMGTGLPDLALIGPKSVRLYANQREQGYGTGQDVAHDGDDRLPMQSGDQASIVAFSDVLGSGQQHLVQIRYNQLTCWPNLGRGAFGEPLVLAQLPFDEHTFNPSRVFLADLDGSGAADLIYAESERFLIFLNQSGNGFSRVPLILPMPVGVRFDQLDQVNFADLSGTGTTSLVLTVTHTKPQHWHYNFAATKPYLLLSSNNNMGTHTSYTYRSSAQEWLDEKQASPESVCELPFAVPVVSTQSMLDEISGNCLTQQYLYRHGVYDGVEREFRGFGFVQHLDTEQHAQATASDLPTAAPTLTKVWYNTGREGEGLSGALPYEDALVFGLGAPRLTRLNPVTGNDDLLTSIDSSTRYQLYRALKGSMQRTEIYGEDASPQQGVPYSVQTTRMQVRLLQNAVSPEAYSVVLPMALEQLSVGYERIAGDPVVQQQVTLRTDEFGAPLWTVGVNYPRQPKPLTSPYPATVPNAMWASTYDESQAPLRLTESRSSVYNLTHPDAWRLGLPYQQRQNVLMHATGYSGYPLTRSGLSYEALIASDSLTGTTQPRTFAGQTVTYYFNASGTDVLLAGTPPPALALVHHQETAELDDESLKAYDGVSTLDLEVALPAAGYLKRSKVLSEPTDVNPDIWVIPGGYSTYVENGNWLPFYRPRAMRSTPIVAPQTFTYDVHSCVVTSVTDGAGNRVQAFYDYRFLSPNCIIDANENTQEVLFDALGQVIASSGYGTQLNEAGESVAIGFSPLAAFDSSHSALASIDAALATPSAAVQQAAQVYLYDFYSWMGHLSSDELAALSSPGQGAELQRVLQHNYLLTFNGRLRSRAVAWARSGLPIEGVGESLRGAIASVKRHPVQAATLLADQYPGATPAAQIRISLSLFDGFGRTLQAKQKCPPGLAYVVNADGTLEIEAGKPVERDTGSAPRWAVSGRTEYDNKGQAVRTYQPYFIDVPIYVNDDSAREWGYADTHYYDPVGREYQVTTALGYLRRTSFYPWFTIAEDENDTLQEVMDNTPSLQRALS